MVGRAGRKVTEKHKYTVFVVGEAEMVRPLELVYEVEAVCVVGILVRLYESPVQEGYVRCGDPQRAAEKVMSLKSLAHTGQRVPLDSGVAPDHGCWCVGSDFLYDPSAFELSTLLVLGSLSGCTSGGIFVQTYPCAISQGLEGLLVVLNVPF